MTDERKPRRWSVSPTDDKLVLFDPTQGAYAKGNADAVCIVAAHNATMKGAERDMREAVGELAYDVICVCETVPGVDHNRHSSAPEVVKAAIESARREGAVKALRDVKAEIASRHGEHPHLIWVKCAVVVRNMIDQLEKEARNG